MVILRKRIIGNKPYYYLEHSVRDKGRVEKRERYIGKRMPKDIERIKRQFLNEIYAEKWFRVLNRIKEGYQKGEKAMPKSGKEKEIESFSIRFTYDSQRIEGSKLTLRETADLLEKGISPKARLVRDIKETEAHQAVFYDMLRHEKELALATVLEWHRKLFAGTKPDIAGTIRDHQVLISGSKFILPSPTEINPLLRQFFKWYIANKGKLHPVELAALIHLKFVTIHPFFDGNGRISRLMMNFILKRSNFPMFNITYENRSGYYNALERSQVKEQETIFLQWFYRRYVKEHGH